MTPSQALFDQAMALLAADATTLAPAMNANKVALVVSDFSETQDLPLASLTLASFTGSAPIAGATGAQAVGVDPLTGDALITILPPAGGYLWKCTVAPTPAQVVFGVVLLDNAEAVLLGSHKLAQSITINAVGDQVYLDEELTFRLPQGSIN